MVDSSAHRDFTTVPDTTERTRLLDSPNTTTISYNSQARIEDERSDRVVNVSLEYEPTVPLDELTDHIQHLLTYRQNRSIPSPHNISNGQDQPTHERIMDTPHQKHKKREIIAGALRFATDQWKENQGPTDHDIHETATGGSPSSEQPLTSQLQGQHQLLSLPQVVLQDGSVTGVWDVAKSASVCAVLGLLSEHRQGKLSSMADTDTILQRLALSTLEHGMNLASEKDSIRQEMLFKPWVGGKSGIQWAVDNDCSIFLEDERVQNAIQRSWLYGDIEWKTNRHHPFQVWNTSYQDATTTDTREGWKLIFTKQFIQNYCARWASPRYQCLIGLVTGFIYLGFHLGTLSNVEYMEDHLQTFEYFYYILVMSDLFLELWKFTSSPRVALRKPSTYLSLSTVILLFAAFTFRMLAFSTIDLQPKYQGLYFSFVLLSIATPLMFFRLFIWTDVLWWPIYKINYIVGQCLVQSLWVFFVALVSVIGFWVGLSALQRDDIGPWLILRYLVLGALHTPEIGDTLYYQPQAASILLVVYLFIMVILIGALLVASFLSTVLSLTKYDPSFDKLQKRMEVKRCSRPASFGVFIPNVAVELVMSSIVWILEKIWPGVKLTGLERFRQVVWFIIFLPIILVVGLVDLVFYLLYL